ncbi:hypothetical protein [Acinetobacter sp.]|uniref:hypothetical protein n=1 Tax=Acinetobacter sp. TaxID=472 RepID=UPI002FC5F725
MLKRKNQPPGWFFLHLLSRFRGAEADAFSLAFFAASRNITEQPERLKQAEEASILNTLQLEMRQAKHPHFRPAWAGAEDQVRILIS